jgi:hypothetical protein
MGKPEVNPMTTTRELQPGSRNSGRMTGSNKTPRKFTKRRLISNSATTKKGNKAGKTAAAHNLAPSDAAITVSRGFITMKRENIKIVRTKNKLE